ncbi:MAG: hypothetical protein IKJ99_06100 [Oscillospiraceae bacterium]|nr:hypothetical protein [Oscillospiraceae bacterium]
MAYKLMRSIMENIVPSVDILKIIRPVYNFKAAEEDDDGAEILWLAEEVLQQEMNPLQRALLDRFCDASAFTVMHMIFYLRAVPTLEALREKQLALLHHHTRREWGEECAKKHHTSYCYFFPEQASPAESRRVFFAQRKIETASTPREFVLAVAEADACLDHWERKIAFFPMKPTCV